MKKYYMIAVLIMAFGLNSMQGFAQITIGSESAPDPDALLDLKEDGTTGESQRGLLLPRVKLISLSNPSPLAEHVEGIMVYNIETAGDVTPGLYKNNGTRWERMLLPDGGQDGMVLEINPLTMAPRWVTKYIPPADPIGAYSLTGAVAYKYNTGAVLRYNENHGGVSYTENSTMDSGWKPIIPTIEINVSNPNNRIILFLQTTLIQEGYAAGGSLSYAAGLFLNDQLKGVRVSVITSTAGGTRPVQKAETLFFVLEGLQTGVNYIDVAFRRRTPSPNNNTVPDVYIGENHAGASGSTSISYEFYEQKTN